MKEVVSIAKCSDYQHEKVKEAVKKIFFFSDGIDKVIKPGEKVLIKPNILSAVEPEKCATTHPEVVKVVAELVLEAGGKPFIADCPGPPKCNFKRISRVTKLINVANDLNIPIKKIEDTVEMLNPGGILEKINIGRDAVEADKVINIPKLKTHAQMILTAGVKNIFGVIVGTKKPELHAEAGEDRMHFARILMEIYKLVKPDFTIVDAVVGMEGDGPIGGDIRKFGFLVGGRDAVAVDQVISHIIGMKKDELYTIKAAKEMNFGTYDMGDISVMGESIKDIEIHDFKFPKTKKEIEDESKEPVGFSKNKQLPVIDKAKCRKCSNCIISCPVAAINLHGDDIKIDYDKCIACFCCREVCPHSAISIEEFSGSR